MNKPTGSCELPAPSFASVSGSRVLRFQPDFHWQGVPVAEYKQAGDHWCGVKRSVLVGDAGEGTSFHLRYFEVAPGGFTSLEEHAHEHAVVVMRGQGQVQLGEAVYALNFGDMVYVAPREVHQFRNLSATQPFGFLCVVDARRDRPLVKGMEPAPSESVPEKGV
jgi:ribulose-bisphosphate carboxylase large chain